MAAGYFRWAPFNVAKQGIKAAQSLLAREDMYLIPRTVAGNGVTIASADPEATGYTFLTHYRDGGYGPTLIDANGNVVHRWSIPYSKVWKNAPHLDYQGQDVSIMTIGAHLFPNGDVLVTYQGGNHPYGGGLVKIDRCSNVIWSLAENAHHWFTVTDSGELYVPTQRFHRDAVAVFPHLKAPFYEDFVTVVSPDGKKEKEISMLKAIYDSGREAILLANSALQPGVDQEDPLHLNDVDVLDEATAKHFPIFAAGDILVSFREINAIAVIDGQTDRIKWSMTGPFLRQHDPDFLPNGHILVFDNRPGEGGSRLLEIDPVTQAIVWEYRGSPDRKFYTSRSGNVSLLPNGNLLVVESQSGRVFELTRDKKVVWEFINGVNDKELGEVSTAQRISPKEATFVGQPCP